jgi:hypothetical protein
MYMGLIEVDTWTPHVWWRRDAYHPERATFLKKKDLQVNLQSQHYCNDAMIGKKLLPNRCSLRQC